MAYFDQAADSNSSAGVTAAVTVPKVTLQLNQLTALPQSLWSSAPAEADAAATSSVKCTVSAVIPVGASQSKRHVTKAISLSTPVNAVSIDVSQAFTADPAEWAKRASDGSPFIIQVSVSPLVVGVCAHTIADTHTHVHTVPTIPMSNLAHRSPVNERLQLPPALQPQAPRLNPPARSERPLRPEH